MVLLWFDVNANESDKVNWNAELIWSQLDFIWFVFIVYHSNGVLLQIDVALVQLNEIASVTFRWWFKGRSIFRCLRSRCRPIRLRQYWQRPMMLVGGKKWSERYGSDETVSLSPTVIQFPPEGDNKWILIENSFSSLKKTQSTNSPRLMWKSLSTPTAAAFLSTSQNFIFSDTSLKELRRFGNWMRSSSKSKLFFYGIVSIGRKDVADGIVEFTSMEKVSSDSHVVLNYYCESMW